MLNGGIYYGNDPGLSREAPLNMEFIGEGSVFRVKNRISLNSEL